MMIIEACKIISKTLWLMVGFAVSGHTLIFVGDQQPSGGNIAQASQGGSMPALGNMTQDRLNDKEWTRIRLK